MVNVQREHLDYLRHLDGARFLAAFWIVCAHFGPLNPNPAFHGAGYRVNVAVCFFVVTSGFVTHWTAANRSLAGCSVLAQFYSRRLGRVVFTFWVSMAFACYVAALHGIEWNTWYLVKCFLFVAQWFQWCPNGPSWFVFALLPSWLLYPVSRKAIFAAERRGRGCLVLLLATLWVLSFGPAVVLFVVQGGNITWQQHADMSFWPPAQLADFGIGMVAAALVRHEQRSNHEADSGSLEAGHKPSALWFGVRHEALGVVADVMVAVVFLVVFLVPRAPRSYQLHLNGWEPLMDHGFSLLFAGFLAATAAAPGCGFATKLLGHRTLVALGERSFEVYLFQRPMHDTFALAINTQAPEVFILYLLSLWAFASVYGRFIQDPVERCIRGVTAGWELPPPEVVQDSHSQ